MNTEPLLKFIVERHNIYTRKTAGEPWPWTADPILQQYRFCNVYRNLDKETQLIHTNWLHPHAAHKDVWFAMAVARLVNWWPTLAGLAYPNAWGEPQRARFKSVLNGRKARGEKVFTGAYMVRADAVIEGGKADYLADYVLLPLWKDRERIRPKPGGTLQSMHTRLMNYRDMGSFMAAQIVADVKYAEGSPLNKAVDFWTWAAPGPGSLRGLNRVLARPANAPWTKHTSWEEEFDRLHSDIFSVGYAHVNIPRISGQDLQNCLCEFDKYERVRLGEGRPRSKYTPPINTKG